METKEENEERLETISITESGELLLLEEGGRKRSVSSPDTSSHLIIRKKKKNVYQDADPILLIQTTGEKITERYGHTAALDAERNRMFVFGGCSTNVNQFLEDVYFFSFLHKKWTCVPSPLQLLEKEKKDLQSEELANEIAKAAKIWPRGRHFHSSVTYNEKMYIFGGKSNGYMSDIWCFDFDTLTWNEVMPIGNNRISTRYGHTSVIYNDSMFIFGGYDGFGLQCNDLWEFNFITEEWNRVKTLGSAPERYHHSAVVFEGSMYIWGGHEGGSDLYEYRFGTAMWSIINTKGCPPSHRWGHKAITVKRGMYIFGGCDHVTNYNDVYCYHFDSCRWEKMKMSGYSQGYFQSIINNNDRIYLFGGRNVHNYDFNDIFEIRLDFGSNTNPNTFMEDFRNLLYSKEFTDISFIFPREGGRELTAHRHILYSRCKKFREVVQRSSGISQQPKPLPDIQPPPPPHHHHHHHHSNPHISTSSSSAQSGSGVENAKSTSSPSSKDKPKTRKSRSHSGKKKKKKKSSSSSSTNIAIPTSSPPSSSSSNIIILSREEEEEKEQLERDRELINSRYINNDFLSSSSSSNIIMIEKPKLEIDWNPPAPETHFVIQIEDVSYDVFRRLLEYIYCGTFDCSSNTAFEFLPVAYYYELDHLKTLISIKIQRAIDVGNVIHALTLADKCKIVDLKQYCLSYIYHNRKEVSPALKGGELDGELLKEVKKYLTVHSLEQQFKAKSLSSVKQSH